MKEQWNPFSDGNYEVSNLGNVRRATPGRRTYPGRPLKASIMGMGYWMVNPVVNGKNVSMYVHRLVAEAFLAKPSEYHEINHKNANTVRTYHTLYRIELLSSSFPPLLLLLFSDAVPASRI